MIDTHLLDLMIGDHWPLKLPPICLHCGYNLTGNISKQCPECGNPFSHKELVDYVDRVRIRMRDLESINAWARLGFRVAVAGAGLLALGLILRGKAMPALATLMQVLALTAGCGAMVMALGILRVNLLPRWARGRMKERVEYEQAYGTMIVGATLSAAALVMLLI